MRNRAIFKIYINLIVLLCTLMIVGCSSQSQNSELITEMPDDHAQVDEAIAVYFQSLDQPANAINKLDKSDVDVVVKEFSTTNGTFFIFSKREHSNQYFAGFNNGAELFEFGDMGYASDNLNIEQVQVFGKTLIKMQGICGAACPINLYVYTENKQPIIFLSADWNTLEVDLDQDGNNEIVQSWGTQPDSKIIILEHDSVLESESLASILGDANSVIYLLDEAIFLASYENNEQRYYQYSNKKLIHLEN